MECCMDHSRGGRMSACAVRREPACVFALVIRPVQKDRLEEEREDSQWHQAHTPTCPEFSSAAQGR